MRPGISITLSPSDRSRLEGIVSNRNGFVTFSNSGGRVPGHIIPKSLKI